MGGNPSRRRAAGRGSAGGAGRLMLELGGRTWRSRLIMGTGGFRSLDDLEEALVASEAEIGTIALTRGAPTRSAPSPLDVIDRLGLFVLPNTAGCYTAREAVRDAHPARERVRA